MTTTFEPGETVRLKADGQLHKIEQALSGVYLVDGKMRTAYDLEWVEPATTAEEVLEDMIKDCRRRERDDAYSGSMSSSALYERSVLETALQRIRDLR